jgi:hypothetical protein
VTIILGDKTTASPDLSQDLKSFWISDFRQSLDWIIKIRKAIRKEAVLVYEMTKNGN